jgi:hypothetical protein
MTTVVSPRENAYSIRLVAFSLASNLPIRSLIIPAAPLWASVDGGAERLKTKAAIVHKAVASSLRLGLSSLLTKQDKALIRLPFDHAH